MASFSGSLETRPFTAAVGEEELSLFKQLIQLSQIGLETVENTTKASPAYGLSRSWTEKTREYWLTKYDW